MVLDNEIYQSFEDVVGERNVSQDPGVLETYRCIAQQSSAHYGPYVDHITPRPQAVILPGSTEEVQNIVRLCNKYKIEFKASTTFWSAMGFIGSDNAIQLDMRRMKHLEIDEKNQMAIIGPHAIGAVVQAEAMKVGLNLNIPGVGCSSSVLASTSGWVGFGPGTFFMGSAGENLLGAEWVLPDGRILRTGSLGAGSGWFCGEGPGPSARGIARGFAGSAGTMGVCCKIAVRLHPWPGPPEIPTEGRIPAYQAVLPDNFKTYTLCFPNWKAYADAFNLFFENQDILYLGHRQYNMFGRNAKGAMVHVLTDSDKQLCDLPELMEDPYIKKQTELMKIDIQVVLAGMTKRNMEYKEKAIDKILELTGGWKNEMMLKPEIANWVLMYLLRLGHKNLNFAYCGAYEGNFGLSGNHFVSSSVMEEAAAIKDQWAKDHASIADTGGDSDMGSIAIVGGGGVTGWEFFINFDAYEKDSIKGTKEFIDSTQEWMFKKGLGVDMGRWNVDLRKPDGKNYSQEEQDAMFAKMPQPMFLTYNWKIRKVFNPNNLTGSYYRTLTPDKLNTD
jgi:hypothetical protein